MFSFLPKKTPGYPTESRWSVLNGEHNGLPLIVRRNESARRLRGHPDYVHRVGVAIALHEGDSRGLPAQAEIDMLNQIEDALVNALEANQDSLQVLAVMTNAMREFVFYTRVPRQIEARIKHVQQQFRSYELQFYVAEDAQWEGFTQFG
ncbi:MAG: DUF695 domain-containing protein [Anaerolineaceae bacterium]|jgi:hypothetical protein